MLASQQGWNPEGDLKEGQNFKNTLGKGIKNQRNNWTQGPKKEMSEKNKYLGSIGMEGAVGRSDR